MAKSKRSPPIVDISGVWYNPKKSGYGVLINNYGELTHSVAIYTFNERGEQVWLVGASNRSETKFLLTQPKASGFMDSIRDKVDVEAGSIEFNQRPEDGALEFKAVIKSEVVYPLPQFSPPPPALLTFEGVLVKLG